MGLDGANAATGPGDRLLRDGARRLVLGASRLVRWGAVAAGVLLSVAAVIVARELAGRSTLAGVGVAALGVGGLWFASRARRGWTRAGAALGLGLVLSVPLALHVALLRPSNDRNWTPDAARLPGIQIEGDELRIENVRTFRWSSLTSAEQGWETRTYLLSQLASAEVIVEPLPGSSLFAHTMISFDFGPGGRLLVSIEARKEQGERYGIVSGALRQFELVYMFLDERDGLVLRAAHRKAELYALPLRSDAAELRAFLLELATAANNLRYRPRFYRSVYDNCTSAWMRHAARAQGWVFSLPMEAIFTGRTGLRLQRMGRLDSALSLPRDLQRFRIDLAVLAHEHDADFSQRIRADLPRRASQP